MLIDAFRPLFVYLPTELVQAAAAAELIALHAGGAAWRGVVVAHGRVRAALGARTGPRSFVRPTLWG